MVLWKQLRHRNLLPFYGAYMIDRLGMVSPWLENGNIVRFTGRNPEVNRLQLVRCGLATYSVGYLRDFLDS